MIHITIILILAAFCIDAQAGVTESELKHCKDKADELWHMAHARDRGLPSSQVNELLTKGDTDAVRRASIEWMVANVYENPGLGPDDYRIMTYLTCVDEKDDDEKEIEHCGEFALLNGNIARARDAGMTAAEVRNMLAPAGTSIDRQILQSSLTTEVFKSPGITPQVVTTYAYAVCASKEIERRNSKAVEQ